MTSQPSLDRLDSRALGRTDCYGRFMQAGTYSYGVLPGYGAQVSDNRPFTVRVSDQAPGKMTQHTVTLRYADRRFTPEQPDLEIDQGDLVVWNCPDRAAVSYVVAGDPDFFGNDRLVNDCGYSHAFRSAGDYRWTDAYGTGVGGVVRVTDPDLADSAGLARWRESLSAGTLVMSADGQAQPEAVQIVTGQTVYFAVVKTAGISVTDERLLR